MRDVRLRWCYLLQSFFVEAIGHFDCIDTAQFRTIDSLIDGRTITVCICRGYVNCCLYEIIKRHS